MDAMRDSPEAAVHIFEGTHENPELIWNDSSRERVSTTVREMMLEYVETLGCFLTQALQWHPARAAAQRSCQSSACEAGPLQAAGSGEAHWLCVLYLIAAMAVLCVQSRALLTAGRIGRQLKGENGLETAAACCWGQTRVSGGESDCFYCSLKLPFILKAL